jgi:hypothetical protein
MRACLIRCVLYACSVLCLGACGLLAPRPPEPLRIAPAILGERTVEQRLLIRWTDGERAMEAVLEIDPERLRLVMLAFGMRLESLEYDGLTLAEQRFVPHAPEGARILNDLLMIAAPLDALCRALPTGMEATERRAEDGRLRREIAQDGAVQIVIDYESGSPWQGRVRFKHAAAGYELVLDSHEI